MAITLLLSFSPPFTSNQISSSSSLFSLSTSSSFSSVATRLFPPTNSLILFDLISGGRRKRRIGGISRASLSGWQEYEDAVREKDLERALKFLESLDDGEGDGVGSAVLPPLESSSSPPSSSASTRRKRQAIVDGRRAERDWEILDACINADDMKLVGSAYSFLQSRGFIPTFGKFQNVVLEGPREVTPAVLKSLTGLEAYLLGCAVRGVILDPIVAMQMGIQGQAGTQFWDEGLENELSEGKLTGPTFDRYCMVLFAGIAAEALVYGDAEGGENDENLFRSICVLLQPPLNTAQMSNRARWSVQQSYNLLKRHRAAHRAVFKSLEAGRSLGTVIRSIEEAMM
ncbi:uncharacterized protein LOC116267406 isoform X2 [Nymphaea colorata]|uniref:uncharacterized protein LOC116267406 isoform X2 n=1 Tax=Nymphaea colorata TaxID=210225 RepID=UPI00129E373F|nr:uncharacterized protein LOC116267406 isoform X2 [Nymphaea colorata]